MSTTATLSDSKYKIEDVIYYLYTDRRYDESKSQIIDGVEWTSKGQIIWDWYVTKAIIVGRLETYINLFEGDISGYHEPNVQTRSDYSEMIYGVKEIEIVATNIKQDTNSRMYDSLSDIPYYTTYSSKYNTIFDTVEEAIEAANNLDKK